MYNVGLGFGVGLPNVIWIGLVIYLITHPEVAAKWGAMLSRLFTSVSKRAERATVGLDIQGRINSFSKSMNSEVPGIMPHGIKIEWEVGEITKESFIMEGKVIVRMNYHSNQDENIVNASMAYIKGGLIPNSRPHVDYDVIKAADLICTKKLLEQERKTALKFYYTEMLGPIRQSNPEIDKHVLAMQGLDELGYFVDILIQELLDLGDRMQFSLPQESVKEETRQFVEFLDEKITKRPPGVDVDPTFRGETINTSIIYVARGGGFIGHQLGWIRKCIRSNVKTIYICAWGKHNISLVNKLESHLESNPRLNKVFSKEYCRPWLKGRKKENICAKYEIYDVDH